MPSWHRRSTVYARGFLAAGVDAKDRVAVWAPNCAEWMLAALGALRAGAVLVPSNTRFKGGEAAYIVRTSGATTLLTVRGFLGADYPAMVAGEDTGALERIVLLKDEGDDTEGCSSAKQSDAVARPERVPRRRHGVGPLGDSGTGGRGRTRRHLGPHLHLGYHWVPQGGRDDARTDAAHLRDLVLHRRARSGDRYLVVNPFFHTFGYKAGILACVMAGATVVPEPVFDAAAVMRRIAAERISVLPGPPTLYQTLLADPGRAAHDLSSLRLGVTGAAVVPVELVHAMRDELGFDTVLTAYGLTESCGTVTMCRRSDPPEIIARTSGRAIPGLEVRAVAEGTEVPAGEPGEIVVRGYTVMSGYWGNEEATADAIDADGWLHTGDIGVMDESGNVTITDRVKDMYVVGGFNAYPAEIEAILRGHEAVAQVAVVGVPDERMGEVGCAYIVPVSAGTDPDELGRAILGWSRGVMANYKVPRSVVLVEELPVNASGKVLKRELRRRHEEGADHVVTTERSN